MIWALIALGVFHGVNPAMGWLFAVARGMQERSRTAVINALPAIAAGHAASVGIVAVVVTVTGSLISGRIVAVGGGVFLVAFGLWLLLRRRHFRWVGMRLSLWQLAGWSFLMSSVHGAGLMLLPVLSGAGPAHHHVGDAAIGGLWAALIHSLAMLLVTGGIAVVVYQAAGLAVLRRAWFNVDRLWAFALVAAGLISLITAG